MTGAPLLQHSDFEDFARGTFGNAGQNLFAHRSGNLQFINWFDLNLDGYPEIVINNDHNPYENVDAMIYYNRRQEGVRSILPMLAAEAPEFQKLEHIRQSRRQMEFLPSLGGGKGLIADLDRDGHEDIVFPNFMHGWALRHFPAFIYWGNPEGYGIEWRSEVPTLAAKAVAADDLNGDGKLELAVANYGMEYHASGTFEGDQYESYLYWHGERGFEKQKRTVFPTEYAVDVEIADLDRNGVADLIFLNTGPRPAVRIFRGSEAGYSPDSYEDIPVANADFSHGIANRLLVRDLNGNGYPDVVATSRGKTSEIFWNKGGNLLERDRARLETIDAIDVAAADLNGDGRMDLVFANYGKETQEGFDHQVPSYVYWGTESGYTAERRTELPTLGASAVEIGDLNGDEHPELVFANHRNNRTYDVPSYIYLGSESGYHPSARQDLHAFGPVDVLLYDFDGNRKLDLFFVNRHSGAASGDGPASYVFWGNEAGHYAPAAMSRLPVQSGYSSSAGDFDGNGHADLVFTVPGSVRILYNRERAFSEENVEVHGMPYRGMTTSLADLNRDGYLDILVGGLHREGKALAVLYGKEDGFDAPQFFDPGMPVISSAVGDVNGDGRLEVIVGGRADLRIIPINGKGHPEVHAADVIEIPRQTQRISLADLNRDGWLEILCAHYRHHISKRLTVPSAVYWNEAGRFSAKRRTDLQTYGGHWVSAADLESGGRLALLFSNYHGERMRTVDLFAFLPQEEGVYGEDRKLTVPAASSSAHMTMDFDQDGHRDLLVVNHTGPNQYLGFTPMSGMHGYGSYLYWGGEGGWKVENRTRLPSFGPHKILNAEPGDIERRRPYEAYISAMEPIELLAGRYELKVWHTGNHRTSVRAFVRFAEAASWRKLKQNGTSEGLSSYFFVLDSAKRRVQYKLHLHSGGSGTGPVVRTVSFMRAD